MFLFKELFKFLIKKHLITRECLQFHPINFLLEREFISDQDENTFQKERSEVRKFNFGVLKPSDVIVQKSENDFPTYHGHYHLPAVNSQF